MSQQLIFKMLKTSVLILFFVCLTFQGELTAEVGGGFSIFSDQPLRNVLARAVSYKASLDPSNNYWNVRIPEITFGAYDSSKVDAYRAFLTSINQKSNWEKLQCALDNTQPKGQTLKLVTVEEESGDKILIAADGTFVGFESEINTISNEQEKQYKLSSGFCWLEISDIIYSTFRLSLIFPDISECQLYLPVKVTSQSLTVKCTPLNPDSKATDWQAPRPRTRN